jgi:hypothetical protein
LSFLAIFRKPKFFAPLFLKKVEQNKKYVAIKTPTIASLFEAHRHRFHQRISRFPWLQGSLLQSGLFLKRKNIVQRGIC